MVVFGIEELQNGWIVNHGLIHSNMLVENPEIEAKAGENLTTGERMETGKKMTGDFALEIDPAVGDGSHNQTASRRRPQAFVDKVVHVGD